MRLFLMLVLLFFILNPSIYAVEDRLRYGELLSINQTLVSNSTIFTLGFFDFGKSPTRYYIGIWYTIDPSAIVWVANRENPVTDDTSTYLAFTSTGNIGIFRGNGSVIWSSNATQVSNATEAIILETGNFVLSLNGNYIWESFDNPTDTIIPYMKVRSYYKQGIEPRLTCWAAADDPSPGLVSFGFNARSSPQIKLWKGIETYWRSVMLTGTSPLATQLDEHNIFVEKTTNEDDQINWWYTVTQDTLTRGVVGTSGIKSLIWNQSLSSWNQINELPSNEPDPCEVYNRCGPNGVCNGEDSGPLCKCFPGFTPKNSIEWNIGNYSSGCVIERFWECSKEGYFFQYTRVKVPDNMVLVRDADETDCLANCTASCNCTAYMFDNEPTLDSKTRCLVWYGDMLDLVDNLDRTEKLNVRIAALNIQDNSYKKSIRLVVILFPVLVTMILILAIACHCMKVQQKRMVEKNGMVNGGETSKSLADVPYIKFSHLSDATDDFSLANKIGEGGFGPVYKGKLHSDQEVAIKRLSKGSRQGFEEFKNEVELIAKLQHTNLVKLLGWCNEHDEKILIYEYVQNGSLDKYLFDGDLSPKLNWGKRWQIIEGIAQGLLYLHRYSRLRVIHRDLKTSNILLDDDMNPKISDFGLARIFDGKQIEANTQRVAGTYGYMSPEYALHGIFSDKSDVFSFGVMLLEIVSSKRNNASFMCEDSLNLLGYVWKLWEEDRCSELADPSSMGNLLSIHQVMKCIHVGLLCVQDKPTDRPTMASVVNMLGNENAILSTPGKPAFIDNIYYEDLQNEITMSVAEAR